MFNEARRKGNPTGNSFYEFHVRTEGYTQYNSDICNLNCIVGKLKFPTLLKHAMRGIAWLGFFKGRGKLR